MKRIILLAVALFLCCHQISAQKWVDALKGVASSAIEEIAGGKLTAARMIGTWNYYQPGIKLSSEDVATELAASAVTTSIQKKLATYYQKVGIRQGSCAFTFNTDGTFTSTFGSRTLSGTYTFNAETSQLQLNSGKGLLNLGSIPAYVHMNGDKLQIVFPVDKLVNILVSLGSKSAKLAPLMAIVQKYDSIKLGFEFTK